MDYSLLFLCTLDSIYNCALRNTFEMRLSQGMMRVWEAGAGAAASLTCCVLQQVHCSAAHSLQATQAREGLPSPQPGRKYFLECPERSHPSWILISPWVAHWYRAYGSKRDGHIKLKIVLTGSQSTNVMQFPCNIVMRQHIRSRRGL